MNWIKFTLYNILYENSWLNSISLSTIFYTCIISVQNHPLTIVYNVYLVRLYTIRKKKLTIFYYTYIIYPIFFTRENISKILFTFMRLEWKISIFFLYILHEMINNRWKKWITSTWRKEYFTFNLFYKRTWNKKI